MKKIINSIKEGLFSYEEADRGYVASFNSAKNLLKAAELVRDAGVRKFDCFTPFPIHGLEKAMGIKRSWVNIFTFIGGIIGAVAMFSFAVYILVIDWPLNIGGKPHFSWPAFIPFTFEIMVLLGGFSTVGGVIALGKLYKINRKPIAPEVTSDKFAIWIGDSMKKEEVSQLLGSLAESVQEVHT